MYIVLIFGLIIAYCLFPFFRCFIKNIHYSLYYSFYDIYHYFLEQKWKLFGYFGIDLFCGMFGKGKTLTMTHRAKKLYNQYGNSLRFISNYHLNNIPYVPLINFNQLVDLGSDDSNFVGTVVLIDEISSILSHRNFANFPLEMLSMLLQQRKRHIYIMCTAQRFFMVDKIFRSITTNVIDCNKIWRFANLRTYDAWEYEQAINTELIKFSNNSWWFVHNSDYEEYDTDEMITKSSAEDFISNEESIIRKGLDSMNTKIENVPKKHIRRNKVKQTR